MTPVYFDTEFTGLHKNTKLISIGMVAKNGDSFYGEFSDFEDGFVNSSDRAFFEKFVSPYLELQKAEHNKLSSVSYGKSFCELYGDNATIAKEVSKWLLQVSAGDKVRMWGDNLAYDWVLFCDLWGHALSLPKHIHYIPMDLSDLFYSHGIDPDINRTEFAGVVLNIDKHHALHDAMVIKKCVELLI